MKRIIPQRKSGVYWTCQVGGWSIYGLINCGFVLAFAEGSESFKQAAAGAFLFNALIQLITSHGYRIAFLRWNWLSLPPFRLLLRLLIANPLIAFTSQLLAGLASSLLFGLFSLTEWSWIALLGYTVNATIVLWLWTVLYFGYHYLEQFHLREVEQWQMEASLRKAELKALRLQMNPHFLFNSLNNIRSLICEQPEAARDAVSRLSDLLRYSLKLSERETVPLEDELSVVKDYLELQSIQLEDRLTYQLKVPDAALTIQIPPMILQTLIENAIRHGVAPLPKGGLISLSVQNANDQIQITIENPVSESLVSSTEGVGLSNVRERLAQLYHGTAKLDFTIAADHQARTKLSIPHQVPA